MDCVAAGEASSSGSSVAPGTLGRYKPFSLKNRAPAARGARRTDFSLIQNGSNDGAEGGRLRPAGIIKTRQLLRRYGVPGRYVKLALGSRAKGADLYCSYNSSVRFRLKDGTFVSFALSRIKYNYVVYFRKPDGSGGVSYLKMDVPGEILDISHEFNEDAKKIRRPLDADPRLRMYRVRGTDLSFYSMSLFGAVRDMELILLNQAGSAPWTLSAKYEKRLYRIVIMYVFMLLSDDRFNLRAKLRWIRELRREVAAEAFTPTPSEHMNRMKRTFELIQRNKHVGVGYAAYKKTLLRILFDLAAAIAAQYASTRNQIFGFNRVDV